MNYKLLGLCILIGVFNGCRKNSSETSIQIVKTNNQKSDPDSVKIFHYTILEAEYLAKAKLDSTGNYLAVLEIKQPIYATIQAGDSYTVFVIRPNDKLVVEIDSANEAIFSSFKSQNNIGHFNNHLNHSLKILNSNALMSKTPEEFFAGYDSLIEQEKKYSSRFGDSIKFTPDEVEMLTSFRRLQINDSKLFYAFLYHNNKLVEQVYAFREKREVEEYKQPKVLAEYINQMEFDSLLLKSPLYSSNYKQILRTYYLETLAYPDFDYKLWDKPSPNKPLLAAKRIDITAFPKSVKEYFLAINAIGGLQEQGLTTISDSVFRHFEAEFPNSKYLPTLINELSKQGSLSIGKRAPNIRGQRTDGTVLNLSDFSGRIVYIDVWATWCAPCVEEIPFSIKLQQHFKNDPNIVFLNISVDKDVNAWKRKLEVEKDWGGAHINLNRAQTDSLGLNYQITGYPTYILIDKEGKIVTIRAKRPSSKEEIKAELERLSKTLASQ
jgi:thiol-disulfide isomerase/thioredoxin